VIEIRRYATAEGRDVFGEWLANLADLKARARIAVRRRQTQTVCGYQESAGVLEGLQEKNGDGMKRKPSISHDQAMAKELRENPEFAVEYLRAALEQGDDPQILLIALRRIAESRGGVAKIAKEAGVERESLYRALSAKGNPRLSTLVAVTKAVGLRLTVEAAH
jgi:probable addiction module antidote protein